MSINSLSSNTAFNFDGVVSGLQTGSIITKLMQLEQGPLNQLTKQQATVTSRDTAYQAIAAKASSLQSAVQSLLLQSSTNGKLATSSATGTATATANANAVNGSFIVNVINLATATSATSSGSLGTPANLAPGTQLTSAGLAVAPTAGTFTINGQSITLAAGDTWSSLQSKISTATSGAVTLNLGANGVSLTSATPVQLGATTDTSNLLSSLALAGAAQTGSGPYTVASKQLLGEAVVTNSLSTAGLSVGGGIAASGSFSVNGVAISWTNGDSVNAVLNRINSSSAGVTASYDPTRDRVTLTNTATGAQNISLSDTSGNFLQAMNLIGASQTFGGPASYTITQNGVTTATQFSNTNTVNNALPGVNLTLAAANSSATITLAQDTTTAVTNINTFVTSFNSMVDLIDTDTKYDPNTKTASVLTGDSTVSGIADRLRSISTAAAIVPAGAAYNGLGSLGITTGAFGSAAGSTNHLVVDTGKLTTALQTNPQAVYQVLAGLTSTTSLTNDPTNPWVASITGQPAGQIQSGSYAITYTPGTNAISSVFGPTGGGAQAAVKDTIAAGGMNSAVIPGLTLTARNPLPAGSGTDTITYNVTSLGVMQSLNDYLTKLTTAGGVFHTELSQAQRDTTDITNQIATQNTLLAQKQTALQAQFTAMEVALAKINSQGGSLLSSLGITPNSNSSSSSGA
jgi:flagellar hook-associated protein 2